MNKKTVNQIKPKVISGLIFTFFTFSLLLFSGKELSENVSETVIFCGKVLIPQLFLYLCLSSLLWELGIIEGFISSFSQFGAEITAFIFGLLLGFPSGALIVGKLIQEKAITKKRGEYILTFSNNTGVSFVFGYVSTVVGKDVAFSIFLSQLVLSLIFAIIGRRFLSEEDKKTYFSPKSPKEKNAINAIKNGTDNMINLCGIIIFFSAFSKLILQFFPSISGFIEMTTGVEYLKSLPFQKRLILSAEYVSFGGICVWVQISSVCFVKTGKYLLSKIVSATFAPILVEFFHFLVIKYLTI